MAHKIIKNSKIDELKKALAKGKSSLISEYSNGKIKFQDTDFLEHPGIDQSTNIPLIIPDEGNNYDFENAQIIYEKYRDLDRTQATDHRLWAYLSHIEFSEYMNKRFSITKQPTEKRGSIRTHKRTIFNAGLYKNINNWFSRKI